jgi:hypothetical protein
MAWIVCGPASAEDAPASSVYSLTPPSYHRLGPGAVSEEDLGNADAFHFDTQWGSIEIASLTMGDPQDTPFGIDIFLKRPGEDWALLASPWNRSAVSVRECRLLGDILLVRGDQWNYVGSYVMVIDLPQAFAAAGEEPPDNEAPRSSEVDYFLQIKACAWGFYVPCIRYSLAPNAEWLAFERWRPHFASGAEWPYSVWALDIRERPLKAYRVYPVDPDNDVSPEGHVHSTASNLLWAPDSSELLFFGVLGPTRPPWAMIGNGKLVIADTSSGLEAIQVRTVPVRCVRGGVVWWASEKVLGVYVRRPEDPAKPEKATTYISLQGEEVAPPAEPGS